jgi:DNA-binding beta-propeller fold protein YncE
VIMRTAFFGGVRPVRIARWSLALIAAMGALLAFGSVAAFAAAEVHPQVGGFGSFSNPNGIAVDESSGDVYVADIGTSTVYKFDANGSPVDFFALASNALTGSGTPAGSFSFPSSYGTPAAIAVDNSKAASDPSAGDLYVMDAGHGVIDKFSPSGEYLSQIAGFTPGAGSAKDNELLGFAVDPSGDIRADVSAGIDTNEVGHIAIDVFDDSEANHLIARQFTHQKTLGSDVPETFQGAHGFAVGPTGDDYLLYESCSCVAKLGQQLAKLGKVDKPTSGDVAIAADPATGHVYVDNQALISEWDTGAMNGSQERGQQAGYPEWAGVLIGTNFGSLSAGSSEQGGIAVNGTSGEIYVSDPGAGKVDVFASEAPAVIAGSASSVTKEKAVLNGTVDPRGVPVSSCQFEYGVADDWGRAAYDRSVSCGPTASGIGTGSSPVMVSAGIEGLKPGLLYRYRLVAANANGSSETSGLFATVPVGFGIKSFDVNFRNQDGTLDTQAGSHPYELVNDIEFNSHYMHTESNADSPYVREPDGTVRDLALNFPPGMVGDPNATTKKCTQAELLNERCPLESFVGVWNLVFPTHIAFGTFEFHEPIYNMVPPRGTALQLGVRFEDPDLFINNQVVAGGDYPVQATVHPPGAAPVLISRVTVFGVVGEGATRKPFLTLPTGCHGPLRSSISMDSYQQPGHFVGASSVMRNAAGAPVALTGCSKLLFPPLISVAPDSTDASTSSGLTVGVHVPQTAAFNPDGLAESALRDTTVTLPEGVTLNPAGADGLQACSEDLAGFTGFHEFNSEFEPGVKTATFTPELPSPLQPGVNFCPEGSRIGTVRIKTPLLEHELEGAVYLAAQNQNPFGSLVAMYMIFEDPFSGSLVKLTGEVKLTATGQIVTTFKNTPDIPFEELSLHFFGGERAPLDTPSRCGTYTTQAVFTPWDGNGTVTATSSFVIDHGPHGAPCPGMSLPFSPSLTAGTTSIQAGGYSPFTMTMSRADGQQNLQAVTLKMPPGLSGMLTGVELCGEAQANAGTCGPNSLIGETIVSVGVGNDPFSVKGGRVYLTGPYEGAPFGLSIVNPAKAGPYDVEKDTSNPSFNPGCDCLVVRAKIEVDPITADITVTTDNEGPYKIPTILDGIPLQIQHVNVTIDRPGFTFNPTDCEPMAVTGALHSTEGSTSVVSVPFQVTNCARMSFKPHFSVSTTGKTSRTNGASLHVRLSYAKLPFGDQANIKSVKVDLPKQLPSRLPTLQKACPDTVFDQNPAACPPASRVGMAIASTPIVPVPLAGPAYFVSHGGVKFPELIIVLQGYGVGVQLHGETFISKQGITSSTFKTIPDVPVGTFELNLPEGPYSALAAPGGHLCTAKLRMPTMFTAQNGMIIHQSTPITPTGCTKHKNKHHKHKSKHKKKK